ncbi:MAG: tetratricopeptide repeat protein [Crocinitomicaceae bacterium]|nr:tetratricopeptide repeat protein [Crocinitomicaceae bacterium]
MADLSIKDIDQIQREVLEANDLVWNNRTSPSPNYDPEKLIGDALRKSEKINYRFGVARCLLNQGMGAFIVNHDVPGSDRLINEARTVFSELNDAQWVANADLTQAIIKNSTVNAETALYLGLKGMEYYDRQPEHNDFRMACYVIGTIYKDLKKHEEAEKYYKRGIAEDLVPNSWSARLYTGVANILNDRGEYNEALSMAQNGLRLLKIEKNVIGISRALNDIGAIYYKLKEYDLAIKNITEALEIRKETKIKHFILGSLIDLANVYADSNKTELALGCLLEAEPVAIETKHNGRLAAVYQQMATMYKALGEIEKALVTYEKLLAVNALISASEKENKISQTELKLVKEKEEEIERLRNVELKNAYEVIAEKNKEITDSIHYAKRIQNTILSPDDELKKYLGEYFIFFQPKDIVSGDFYWSMVMKRPYGNEDFYLAVCDSTGHGVPGAFMSLLNTNLLNEAIYEKQIEEPNLILNYVRQRLIDSISKEGQKDGFDGILIRYCRHSKKIAYAAANNVPVLVRKNELTELKADKMPVGFGEKKDSFTLHEMDVIPGDHLYLFTDGYADQFGGEKGKKFKYRSLHELICKNASLPVHAQKENLAVVFENWKGSLEQVDDVCILGFRVG